MLNQNLHLNILENLQDGVYFADCDTVIRYWNKAAEKITGFKSEEVIGHSLTSGILNYVKTSGDELPGEDCPLSLTISDKEHRSMELFLHHKNGHIITLSIKTSPLLDEAGAVLGGVELLSDITTQKASSFRLKELETIAYMDHLTKLSNRLFIEKELNSRLDEYMRYHLPFGILFLDVDNFKKINDSYGHSVGDDVLRMISKTFTINSRPFDLFGRWGGEEFIGIVRNVDKEQLTIIGERVRQLVEESFILVGSDKLRVTASLGGTVAGTGDDLNSIVTRADRLMYRSKTTGKNKLSVE